MFRKKKVLVWIATGVLGLVFLMVGLTKLSGGERAAEQFAGWGYPAWFAMLIGVVEALGAILLFVPRFARFGAIALLCVMVGAAGTHVRAGEWSNLLVNVLFGSGLWWIWKARSGQHL